ncbi:MAG: hypothetical protein K2L87_06475 [Clostridiales bacterium]|nr:hypothetical protein [Clostridiales bacterium]
MKEVLHIAPILKAHAGHISFHTPGHKKTKDDLTELSYTDNLSSPTGAIARAEEDIARILGADKSFILTDGSTSGVLSMLYAAKCAGVRSVALSPYSHRSIKNGCLLLGIVPVFFSVDCVRGIPMQPSEAELKRGFCEADAVLLTSPDYYGYLPSLKAARALADGAKKPLLIDGAHGSHLHFTEEYAGRYADLWVDGVHKSLPALTQGAVVSAKGKYVDFLREGVGIFRTTSPSYPIMASVEYAVKYPRKLGIERAAENLKRELHALENDDWTKIVLPYGANAARAQQYLEENGLFPEFNDGNYIMFYLSPCTKLSDLKTLVRLARGVAYGEIVSGDGVCCGHGEEIEEVPLQTAAGRICAREFGLFPPCIPLVVAGEKITESAIGRLRGNNGTFGIESGNVLVYKE